MRSLWSIHHSVSCSNRAHICKIICHAPTLESKQPHKSNIEERVPLLPSSLTPWWPNGSKTALIMFTVWNVPFPWSNRNHCSPKASIKTTSRHTTCISHLSAKQTNKPQKKKSWYFYFHSGAELLKCKLGKWSRDKLWSQQPAKYFSTSNK